MKTELIVGILMTSFLLLFLGIALTDVRLLAVSELVALASIAALIIRKRKENKEALNKKTFLENDLYEHSAE